MIYKGLDVVEVYDISYDLGKRVIVKDKHNMLKISETINKPILLVKNGTISRFGLEGEDVYDIFVVIDNGIYYMYFEKVDGNEKN